MNWARRLWRWLDADPPALEAYTPDLFAQMAALTRDLEDIVAAYQAGFPGFTIADDRLCRVARHAAAASAKRAQP